jgi:hypothetical protein
LYTTIIRTGATTAELGRERAHVVGQDVEDARIRHRRREVIAMARRAEPSELRIGSGGRGDAVAQRREQITHLGSSP